MIVSETETTLDDHTKALRYDEFVAIHRAELPLTAKAVAFTLVLNAEAAPAESQITGYRVIEGMTVAKIAEASGIKTRAAADAIGVLVSTGAFSKRNIERAINAQGKEIPRNTVNLKRGDRFLNSVVYSIPHQLQSVPPPTQPTGKNADSARERSAAMRIEFRRIRAELQAHLEDAQCPRCHHVGTIRLDIRGTCADCGETFNEAELEVITENIAYAAKFAGQGEAVQVDPNTPKTIESPTLQNLQDICTTLQSLQDRGESTEGGGSLVLPPPEILTGEAILDYFDGLGGAFCLTESKNGRKVGCKPCDDLGQPIAGNYLDLPQPLIVAAANLKHGKSAGLLIEYSVPSLLDIDHGLESFLTMFPVFCRAVKVFRAGAPDRAKFVILVTEHGGKMQRQDAKQPTRKAELLGDRNHGSIAGPHPSGEDYLLQTGDVLVFSRAEIEAMLAAWIPEPFVTSRGDTRPIPPPVSALNNSTAPKWGASSSHVHEAVLWWIVNHEAEVLDEIAKLRGAGPYVALREDDKTPSALRTDLKDKFGRAVFRDYGTNETLDAFEIYCRLNKLNKRDFIRQTCADFRAATQAENIMS